MSLKQGQAVYNTLTKLYKEKHGVDFTNESPMTKNDFDNNKAKSILIEGFAHGEIDLSDDFDKTKLGTYVSGLINNWLRKDKRLNGNTTYVPKNPGSRAGTGDKQVAALRMMLKQMPGTHPERVKVEQALAARIAELKPKTQVEIDVESVPPELRHLISQ